MLDTEHSLGSRESAAKEKNERGREKRGSGRGRERERREREGGRERERDGGREGGKERDHACVEELLTIIMLNICEHFHTSNLVNSNISPKFYSTKVRGEGETHCENLQLMKYSYRNCM